MALETLQVPSRGVRAGLPCGEQESGAVLRQLLAPIEERHQIKPQTVFCWLRGSQVHFQRTRAAAAYRRAQESHHPLLDVPRLNFPIGELPAHHEPVEVFEDAEGGAGCVFSLPLQDHQILEKSLLNQGLFPEDFLTFATLVHPLGRARTGPQALLGLYEENSVLLVFSGSAVLHLCQLDFSLAALAKTLAERWQLKPEQGRAVLDLAVPTAFLNTGRWKERLELLPVLDAHLGEIKDFLADEFERLAHLLRAELETAGQLKAIRHPLLLTGEGARLYASFAFLRDVLPLEPEVLTAPGEKAGEGPGCAFSPLIILAEEALERRRRARARLQQAGTGAWRGLWRRLFLR